jgi:O-acetyl-ADP-ribose deacetylase (regulator of RNase III)
VTTAAERAKAGRFPPIVYVRGDATRPEAEGLKLILHVCNDVGAWGAGFVMALSRRWKAPQQFYLESPFSKRLSVIQPVKVESDINVINMIAQHGFPSPQQPCALDYRALHECLRHIVFAYEGMENVSIHMPRIGCGIAGGDWSRVELIVQETLSKAGFPVTVYDLPSE